MKKPEKIIIICPICHGKQRGKKIKHLRWCEGRINPEVIAK